MSVDLLALSPPVRTRLDVVILRWPAQEELRSRLANDELPRLLLIDHECPAPRCADDLEDWVREPLDAEELEVRAATLQRRAAIRALRPRVDDSGLVHVGRRWIDLPRIQVPVARLLVSGFGAVVPAEQIQAAYRDAGGSIHPKAVKAMIGRIKRRLAELDLVLTNVRDRGYLLESPEQAGPVPVQIIRQI